MIEATGLTKRYGKKTAVDGISFSVQPAADAMIHASKWATGLPAGVLVLGLAATPALPALPADGDRRSGGKRSERVAAGRATP